MKKHTSYIIITAILIVTAFLLGRNSIEPTIQTITKDVIPDTVDLSQDDQLEYIDSFLASIVDYNAGYDELAVYTSDGYELYVQRHENVYKPQIKAYMAFDEIESWTVDDSILIITTKDGNNYEIN